MTEDLIEIGTIVAPHGIKGEVKVYPDSDFPERFETPGKRWLKRPEFEELELVTLKKGYYLPGKHRYVLTLEEVTDRDQAEALKKSKLLIPKRDRPQLEEDEYHVSDLIDLKVIDQHTGKLIGTVVDIYTAGNDLLVVQLDQQFAEETVSKHEVLIPFVKALVPVVDIQQEQLEVTLPSGLLEAC
ncbi:MAG: ribosome maturation factor RimM [Halothece sp.]